MPYKISGSVLDNNLKIISFANVEVKAEKTFATANENGQFTIVVSSEKAILRFSHAGYDYDEVSVAEFKKLGNRIELYPSSLSEDGVIVINDYKKPKDNTLKWLLAILAIGTIIGVASYKKPQKVKA